MYDPPGYLWAITIAGIIAIPAAACVVLYGGAVRAGVGRRHAALLAGGAAVVLGGGSSASAVIASHGWYRGSLCHTPWLAVAVAGFLGAPGAQPHPSGGARPGGSRNEEPSPARTLTATPLLGPADRGTMVSLMDPADPGTATPLMLSSW